MGSSGPPPRLEAYYFVFVSPSSGFSFSTMTEEQRFVGIGDKKSSKVSAPPGGKSSIGLDDSQEVSKHVTQPKNSAAAAKARDLSTNFMAPEVPSSDPGKNGKPGEGEVENQDQKTEPPRPKGAPNRAKHPPGGASHGPLW